MSLTDEQSQAMRLFVKTCNRLFLVWGGLLIIALLILVLTSYYGANRGQPELFPPLVMAVGVVIHQIMFLRRVHSRTGLIWHFFADPNRYTLILALPLVIFLPYILSNLLRGQAQDPVVQFVLAYPATISLVILYVVGRAVNAASKARANAERERYADHWLALSRLSFRDVLLLSVPYESVG